MFDARSDGSDNFIGSLIIAGSLTIPEVTVFFHNKLMRGNRTIKFSSNNLDPFHSPNAPDIAKLNTEIVGRFVTSAICTCFNFIHEFNYDQKCYQIEFRSSAVNYDEILYPNKLKEFTVQKQLDEHVGILRIFPNIQLILVSNNPVSQNSNCAAVGLF